MPAAVDTSIHTMELREFRSFRTLIHDQTGIWLRDGKQVMLASRLSRRLRHHGMADFAEYYEYVRRLPSHSEEMRELINCVTTNKTSFFREAHHFEFLCKKIVPELCDAALHGAPRTVRIWSAASSSGEEAYTIAISLLEVLRQPPATAPGKPYTLPADPPRFTAANGSWNIEVIASDIDTKVLEAARRAVYREDAILAIPAALQRKYFLRGKDDMRGSIKVKTEVARLVHFQRINLKEAQWPVEGPFDVIFFRNALIYFNRETQDEFLRKMVRLLKPRGYLFLGNSEHIPWLHDILEPLNRTMYRLRHGVR